MISFLYNISDTLKEQQGMWGEPSLVASSVYCAIASYHKLYHPTEWHSNDSLAL